MAMKKKAPAKKAAPKNSTGGDQPVRAGVGKERANYIKEFEARYPKESSDYDRRYAKALKALAKEYGFDRGAGPNRNPKLRGRVGVESDSGYMYSISPGEAWRSGTDLGGRTGKVRTGNSGSRPPKPGAGRSEDDYYPPQVGTVRGRTTQRGIDQAKRRKAANAKKVAKGKK